MSIFEIKIEIEDNVIESLIVDSMELGSTYWNTNWKIHPKHPNTFQWNNNDYAKQILSGEVDVLFYDDVDEGKYLGRLSQSSIQDGLELMSRKYPEDLALIIGETRDCLTADLFLQLCVMNKIVYS